MFGDTVVSLKAVTSPSTVAIGEPPPSRYTSYAAMPLASVEAVHVRSTRVPDGALACRLLGAVGGVVSGEKF